MVTMEMPMTPTISREIRRHIRLARAKRIRTVGEFATQEIVIPTGPHAGSKYRFSRAPWARHIFEAMDQSWELIALVGPSQSGKTLAGFIIPTLYHLFEIGETVVCGVPDLAMVKDKWAEDLLPAIERTRYRDLIPTIGEGSRGGVVREAVRFGNGATLRFMTGGSSDKARAGFTTRVLIITEVDGFDRVSATSREADQVAQLMARVRAWSNRSRVYMESTASTHDGRIWREFEAGTASRVAVSCPHCNDWVTPDREHLVGWDGAKDIIEARENARLCCPSCACEWTDVDRRSAYADTRLVHRGQEIDSAGHVHGDQPRTLSWSMKWTASDNLLVPIGVIAAAEWNAKRDPDQSNAEREMRQFWWARTSEGDTEDESQIDQAKILNRIGDTDRGIVPDWCEHLTAAIDQGKHLCHWVVIAWGAVGQSRVIDYGRLDVASGDLVLERAITVALGEFDSMVQTGWPTVAGGSRSPELVLADSGWHADTVYDFCRGHAPRWCAAKGFGAGQYAGSSYREPKTTGNVVSQISDGYHVARLEKRGTRLLEVNVDRWKSQVHQRLNTAMGESGAMDLFRADVREHITFASHLASERQVGQFKAGKGWITTWKVRSRQNHWLDAVTLAAVAGHVMGVRVQQPASQLPRPMLKRRSPRVTGGWQRR